MVDLSVKIGGFEMANPVMPASGTFSPEMAQVIDIDRLGATVTKTISRELRDGNPPPRVAEVECGVINCIGLPGKGLDYYFFYGDDLPEIISQYTTLTGRSPMPPAWSFGVWLSDDSWMVADEGRAAVDRMRDEKIPCDVINYEMAWQGANNPPGCNG